jgi:hypothetical protein
MKENITIMGCTFEVENVPYEAVKPMPAKPIKELICCCCGNQTRGRQWWNRDTGFGLCVKCAEVISKKEDEETMKSCYGEKGKHYAIAE